METKWRWHKQRRPIFLLAMQIWYPMRIEKLYIFFFCSLFLVPNRKKTRERKYSGCVVGDITQKTFVFRSRQETQGNLITSGIASVTSLPSKFSAWTRMNVCLDFHKMSTPFPITYRWTSVGLIAHVEHCGRIIAEAHCTYGWCCRAGATTTRGRM